MSLRRKTLLIIGLVVAGLVVVVYLASRTVLVSSYEQLEDRNTRQNVARLVNSINDELTKLSSSTADYARWDDAYAFMEDKNQAFIDANLADPFFVNLRLNLMAFIKTDGQQVFVKTVDLQKGSERPLPEDLNTFLAVDSPLLKLADKDSTVKGVIMLKEGPMLVASRPVLDSLAEKPSRGTLIFGQFLNAEQIQILADSLSLPIQALSYTDPALPPDFAAAKAGLSPQSTIFVRKLDDKTVAGYALISDLYNQPALIMRVDIPADISAQGQSSINLFLLLLVGTGIVLAVVTIFLLETTVLSPITRLSRDVNEITTSGEMSGRMSVSGSDELGRLGRDINVMLASLEQAQHTLHESDERLRTVVKGAPILLWAVDDKAKLTLLEGEGLKLLGLKAGQAVGQPVSDVYRNIPQIVDEMRRTLRGDSFNSIVPVKDFTFDTHYQAVRDDDGKVIGAIGVATNITERIMAEQALGEAYENLERQKRQLERARILFRSTLDQLTDTLRRGANKDELDEYLEFVQTQFNSLEG
jgi:PAS domain S-box-containing protein